MTIRESLRKMMKGSKIKEGCNFDKEAGTIKCESRRVTEDGEEVIGEANFSLNQHCEVVPSGELWETEEGTLDRLDRKFVSKIRTRCQKKSGTIPEDY